MFGLSASETLVLGTGILAVLMWLIWMLRVGSKLGWYVGDVKWDFTSSWASTLTAVGALLGSTLSAGTILGGNAGKSEFGGLNLLFGFMVALAPLFYKTTRYFRSRPAPTDPPDPGHVWTFLIANALTFWAVTGEVATIFVVVGESVGATGLKLLVATIFQAVLGGGMLIVVLYGWLSVPSTVDAISVKPVAPQKGVDQVVAQVPQWSLM